LITSFISEGGKESQDAENWFNKNLEVQNEADVEPGMERSATFQ
jgi:hypothetical protein